MCGRYALPRWTLESAEDELAAEWRVPTQLEPRYNIAPTQNAPVVRIEGGQRVLDQLRWGLIPGWAQDATMGAKLINARAETASEKTAFRDAFRVRRCLVPAGGFYEWQRTGMGTVPYWIHAATGATLVFAGLWERWRPDPTAEPLETFTILTTSANGFVRSLHDRMPLILDEDQRGAWLDPHSTPQALTAVLTGTSEIPLAAHAVDKRVGSPREDDAGLIEPFAASQNRVELQLPLI